MGAGAGKFIGKGLQTGASLEEWLRSPHERFSPRAIADPCPALQIPRPSNIPQLRHRNIP